VTSLFRSVIFVTHYNKYHGLVKWFEALFNASKNEGMRHIYVGLHDRNMSKVQGSWWVSFCCCCGGGGGGGCCCSAATTT
jgi:hypothetical protein